MYLGATWRAFLEGTLAAPLWGALQSHVLWAWIKPPVYFWDARNLNVVAETDDVRAVTIKVNGGLNGLPDREARLKSVKEALGI